MTENNKSKNIQTDNVECCENKQCDTRFNDYSLFISRDGDWTAQQDTENSKGKVHTKKFE